MRGGASAARERGGLAPEVSAAAFATDLREYIQLQPRQLPSRYLYDALGSALFDAICELPWYPVTRAEMRLLATHARTILDGVGRPERVVELGAGNGRKLAALVQAGLPRGPALPLHLVDVSAAALATAARTLSGLGARVSTHQAPYEEGIARAAGPGRSLVLFLGSNIGNFDPPGADAFLSQVRQTLAPGDRLLLGVDLVKPPARLLLAYDDPLQVTAAFNRNLLVRINRELDADFDVARFRHQAVWNEAASRIEMHLVSTCAQHVHIRGAHVELPLCEGERIWTESSYKYTDEEVQRLLGRCGYHVVEQWIDQPGQFALTLAVP